jgi:hypothetical protein
MNPLNVVVPFDVFTVYRDRRLRGGDAGDATGQTPGAGTVSLSRVESGCVEILAASPETAVDTPALAQPVTERIPS